MKKFFGTLVVLSIVLSCASEKPKGKTEAEVLFKEAKILVSEERYLLAIEKINSLKNQFPYSYYSVPAELLQADIFYAQENFVEAAAAYMLFRDMHPRHEKIGYVVFRIAESYYNQLPDTNDRDLSSAVEAIQYYGEVITKYPASKHLADAKIKIEECKEKLRGKEKYIADFYFKTEVFSAARWRYLEILSSFKNKELRSHSMQRVVQSSYYLKEYNKCLDYIQMYSNDLLDDDKQVVSQYKTYCQNKIN